MAHLQYIPGDPRLVDQLVFELKSKGIFDQFRKDCIADVDTRPAYQNLRQRVENSVSTFLARQVWKPDLNKNQLREKLRKHILDGNYLEQGVERIVDQVVNPKVSSVFIPQVEDLVYNYLGIPRKKSANKPETSNEKVDDTNLLPTDLEAVSPGSVKSNEDKNEAMDINDASGTANIKVTQELKVKEEINDEKNVFDSLRNSDLQDPHIAGLSEVSNDSNLTLDKNSIPMPLEDFNVGNIPAPEKSPPEESKMEIEKLQLQDEINFAMDIPLPDEIPKVEKDQYFKPVNSDDDSSSDSSLRRNMSPLTPIRNFNNENSCDAQQAFDNDSKDGKSDKKEVIEPSTFRFKIESKTDNTGDVKEEKKETDQTNLSYQFHNQVNINTFNTPMYDDSSNSNLLHIDYESDANSKLNVDNKVPEVDQNSEDSKKDKKHEERKSSHKSSHRDSHRHSSSKDRRSDSKKSSSKDSKNDRKSSRDDHRSSSKSSHKERSSDRSDRKDSRESSKYKSSHKGASSSRDRDSKSHRSSSSSQKHSSSRHSDEKKSSSSSHRDKDRSSKEDKYSKEKSVKDSKSGSSSHRSDKDRKSSSSSKSRQDEKDKKKDKKETDDHYSASGRGSNSRRSTDRDSNDGSSSSKGSQNQSSSKTSDNKKETKSSTSKSDGTSTTSGDSASPSDKDNIVNESNPSKPKVPQTKPVIRVETHLEIPIMSPPRLPLVPDVTIKKPKIAANLEEAKKLMKMRKFLDEEQKRMNQEAALLLEFQANVRPSLSQVYSSIPGPELEFACVTSTESPSESVLENHVEQIENLDTRNDSISDILNAAHQVDNIRTSKKTDKLVTGKSKRIAVAESETDSETGDNSYKATARVENAMNINNDEVIKSDLLEQDKSNSKVKSNESNESEDKVILELNVDSNSVDEDVIREIDEKYGRTEYFEVTIIAEELSDSEDSNTEVTDNMNIDLSEETPLKYFGENEKTQADFERDTFRKFLNVYSKKSNKMFVINCNKYEENILKEVVKQFGCHEIVNYHKNGVVKMNKTVKNVVKDLNVSSELTLPIEVESAVKPPLMPFSPAKSECSFELSSDYDARLEEMVSKTSRQEIMEIILGSGVEEATNETDVTIDYCTESNIDDDELKEHAMKRKIYEVESTENNNRRVLTPNKIRRLSESDQISSTTEDTEEKINNNVCVNNTHRSKYLGRAKRVGLPRPRKTNFFNSPSSDKSIENYEHNPPAPQLPNGKLKMQRNKEQRYATSDLYKPKLHYLSRRSNIS